MLIASEPSIFVHAVPSIIAIARFDFASTRGVIGRRPISTIEAQTTKGRVEVSNVRREHGFSLLCIPYGNSLVVQEGRVNGEREDRSLGARASRSEEVARAMHTLIFNGEVAASNFLRIDEKASRLRTSHTPVREALMTLKAEGFVESEPRKGFRALPLAPEDIDDAFSVLGYLSGEINARAAARFIANKLGGEIDVGCGGRSYFGGRSELPAAASAASAASEITR